MQLPGARRIQFSIRSLLLITAVMAISLVPVAWVMRERQEMLRVQLSMQRAREEAIRSVLLADAGVSNCWRKGARKVPPATSPGRLLTRPTVPPVSPEILIEHLRRENNELKDTVDSLRVEVQRLRAGKGH